MPTTMREAVTAWKGLGLRLSNSPDFDDCPPDDTNVVGTALVHLGGAAPANVLLLAMQEDGYDNVPARILAAVTETPQNFDWYRIR